MSDRNPFDRSYPMEPGESVESWAHRHGFTLQYQVRWIGSLKNGLPHTTEGPYADHDAALTAATALVAAWGGSARLHHLVDGLFAPWSSPCGVDEDHEWHGHGCPRRKDDR